MQPDKLIMMANQIATYFKTQPGTGQAEKVADHINDFWEPRMRRQLAEYVDRDGRGLTPLARDAMTHVRLPAE